MNQMPTVESVNRLAGDYLYRAIHARNHHNFDKCDRRIAETIKACDSLLGPNDWMVREKKCGLNEIVLLEVKAWWHLPTTTNKPL